MEKTCRYCKKDKPLTEFSTQPDLADGYKNICRDCVREYNRQYREERKEELSAYEQERAKTRDRREYRAENTKRWRESNPDGYAAHNAVGEAIRTGKLLRGPCEVCGSLDVHAHHDDYSKPLTVHWLCAEHHAKHHAEQRSEGDQSEHCEHDPE
jgi:hypothetical protein